MSVASRRASTQHLPTGAVEVLIVGAGFGGDRHGDRAATPRHRATSRSSSGRPDLGGTWFYNSYPGAACDVPSHLYSFSFAQRRDWSRLCSPQPEIHDYLHDVARDHGVERLLQHGHDGHRVRAGTRSTAAGRSRPPRATAREADALVLATGQLHQPTMPAIAGHRRRSPATASTRPAGTTTTRSRASGWRSSAPARAPSSSCPRSPGGSRG